MTYQPKGITFEKFEIGQEFVTSRRTVTEADIVSFAGLSGDFNPLHTDEEFAKGTPFKSRIAHGVLCLAVATGLANQLGIFEGTTIALAEMITRYTGAVKPGDSIHVKFKILEKKESKKGDRGTVKVGINVLNQREEKVIDGHWVVIISKSKA